MKTTLSPGTIVKTIMNTEAYPRRAFDKEDFHDMLYSDKNVVIPEGDILTIINTSSPSFHRDDTWYMAIAPGQGAVWLIDAHNGIFYKPL